MTIPIKTLKATSLLIFLLIVSCNDSRKEEKETEITDNEELKKMYQSDQSERMSGTIDWSIVAERDKSRQKRVKELLDSGKVRTSDDYYHTAMIFQHGMDTVASGMAVKMMEKAIELDSARNKWLLAAAIDRHLMRKGEPQIYGTQFTRNQGEPWRLYNIDTTVISDQERVAYGVETLAEQREKVKRLNKKNLGELLEEGKSIDEILVFIKSENQKETESQYDYSEMTLNNFGYQFMAQDDSQGALKIFKLNTELYPNAYNTFDSYGECLLALGKKEEAVKAYKRSLELNPDNDNAREIITKLEKNDN